MERRALFLQVHLDDFLGVVPRPAHVGHEYRLVEPEERDRHQVADEEVWLQKREGQGREDHRGGPDDRRADQHGLGRRLEGVAGAVVLLEQVLGRLEIHVDAVVALERLRHVRNLLDEGQLEDRLGIIGDGAVGIHRDRHRPHAEEAERDQAEREDRRRDHQRPQPERADHVRDPHQHDDDHAEPVRAEVPGHESRQDAERGAAFPRRRHHFTDVVTSAREGGASLGILSGLVAGNFSAYWLGMVIVVLMGIAYMVSTLGLGALMVAPAVFAFGLVAFGFLGMGPVTIAVDSYGPVTDNAQSVFELSLIEQIPNVAQALKRDHGIDVNFESAKHLLEENDGAGNTFKATAKPVLIGTAVVGATTMIFSIIVVLTHGLTENLDKLSLLHPPFLLGLVTGGAVIYWFTGASMQAVTTGAYRAVEFIKANIRLEGVTKASVTDSKRVVEICTQYAQKGMFNIFLTVFFATLAFAFLEPYFFIGYLMSIALFGLFQAIFMANAGGAWDNAKKIVETELKEKGSALHAATVVGDTVGDPFKDTSSVAMNPVIKFTTLFGLLAVELAVNLTSEAGPALTRLLAAAFFAVSIVFLWRSFYTMRIKSAT